VALGQKSLETPDLDQLTFKGWGYANPLHMTSQGGHVTFVYCLFCCEREYFFILPTVLKVFYEHYILIAKIRIKLTINIGSHEL